MSVLQSIFLGIVQGLTEFLPVSSSGHLAILENIFHIETDGGLLFDIMLHVGTLTAVILVYHKDIGRMIIETLRMIGDLFLNFHTWTLNKRHRTSLKYRKVIHNNYRKFVVLILISTIPTGVIGILMKDLVSASAGTLLIPGICLLITGILLLIAEESKEGRKLPREVSYKNSLVIGAVQGLASLPGLSRSGTTIAACLLSGMDRKFAVKYSFILSIPAVLGAALLELEDLVSMKTDPAQLGIYAVGMVVAGIVGYISMKTMLIFVRRKKFRYFSYYCFAAGAIAIAGHYFL